MSDESESPQFPDKSLFDDRSGARSEPEAGSPPSLTTAGHKRTRCSYEYESSSIEASPDTHSFDSIFDIPDTTWSRTRVRTSSNQVRLTRSALSAPIRVVRLQTTRRSAASDLAETKQRPKGTRHPGGEEKNIVAFAPTVKAWAVLATSPQRPSAMLLGSASTVK